MSAAGKSQIIVALICSCCFCQAFFILYYYIYIFFFLCYCQEVGDFDSESAQVAVASLVASRMWHVLRS